MKGFRTYEIHLNDLKKVQKFVDMLIRLQIGVEVIPSQHGRSEVIVHLRQGDNQQYRNMLDLCIKQEIPFDSHDYTKEREDE
jgi:hypothetical protein